MEEVGRLNKLKVIITGANSFVGQRIIHFGLKKGWNITGFVRKGTIEMALEKGAKYVFADMSEYPQKLELSGRSDCLINLAWRGTRGLDREDSILQKMNREETIGAIKTAIENGVSTVVTAGSQLEYGHHLGLIDESVKCNPDSEYGKQKYELFLTASDMCLCNNVRIIEPRFFSLYGPGDYKGTMIMSIINKMLSNEQCLLTECTQLWDYLYVDDAAAALVELINNNDAKGVYNFGSGDCRELKAYVEEMRQITRSSSEIVYGAVPYPETGPVSIWPDVSKLTGLIGNYVSTDFESGVKKIINSI